MIFMFLNKDDDDQDGDGTVDAAAYDDDHYAICFFAVVVFSQLVGRWSVGRSVHQSFGHAVEIFAEELSEPHHCPCPPALFLIAMIRMKMVMMMTTFVKEQSFQMVSRCVVHCRAQHHPILMLKQVCMNIKISNTSSHQPTNSQRDTLLLRLIARLNL